MVADADQGQLDLQGGIRQKRSLGGFDLAATGVLIRGDRTSASFATLRGSRLFLEERLGLDLEAGYTQYLDKCAYEGAVATELNCTGTAKGTTLRGGLTLTWRRDKHWLFLGDYHLARNTATSRGDAGPGGNGGDASIGSPGILIARPPRSPASCRAWG